MTDEQEPTPLQIQQTRARAERCLLTLMELRARLAQRRARHESWYYRGAGEWPDLLRLDPSDVEGREN